MPIPHLKEQGAMLHLLERGASHKLEFSTDVRSYLFIFSFVKLFISITVELMDIYFIL